MTNSRAAKDNRLVGATLTPLVGLEVGQEVWPAEYQTPAALAAWQKVEIAKWTPVIKESGIKGE